MPERGKPDQNDLAIGSMQKWIETEVVGRNICPPLVKLVNQFRDPQGNLDWQELGRLIDIEPFLDIKPYKRTELVKETLHSYMQFMQDAVNGTAPFTKILVLPDFLSNIDYDRFANGFKDLGLVMLANSPEYAGLSGAVLSKWSAENGVSTLELQQLLGTSRGNQIVAANVIERAFSPVYFYGKELSNRDVADFRTDRGPLDRQKVLSRAPYYAVQVVNSLMGRELIGNLNREGLYQRNTRLARETKPKDHETKMRRLRGGK